MSVDAGEFAVLDQRGDHRPVVAALVGFCKQGVLAVESERAIIEEAEQPPRAREHVADRPAQKALGADLPTACFEVLMRVVDDRPAALITDAATLVNRIDAPLDRYGSL